MKRIFLFAPIVLAACSHDEGNGSANSAEIEVNSMQAVEFTGGSWTHDGPAAMYVAPPDQDVLFAIRCDKPNKRIVFLLAGSLPDGGSKMRVETDKASLLLPAHDADVGDSDDAMIEASTDAKAPFVEALTQAPQRIGIKLDGGEGFVAPGDAAVEAVVRSCR